MGVSWAFGWEWGWKGEEGVLEDDVGAGGQGRRLDCATTGDFGGGGGAERQGVVMVGVGGGISNEATEDFIVRS